MLYIISVWNGKRFKELVNAEFTRGFIDECYEDNIIWILNDYRGSNDDDFYEDDENIQDIIIDEDGEHDYEIWTDNEIYKFENNMVHYVGILLETTTEKNKVEFIKSIVDSLNSLVILK